MLMFFVCETCKLGWLGFNTFLALQRPYLWSPPAEQMQILKGDDLSPTALDAYELVKSFVPPVIPEVRQLLQGLGYVCVFMLSQEAAHRMHSFLHAATVCLLCVHCWCTGSCLVLQVPCLR